MRRGSSAPPSSSRLDLSSTVSRQRQCDGDNGHLKCRVHLSHEERKQQQQQSTHSHTPDLAFTIAFAALIVSAFVVSIALVGCCVVRSRHANCWAVRRGELSPSPPPPPSSSSSRLDLFFSQFQRRRSSCRHAGSANYAGPADSRSGHTCSPRCLCLLQILLLILRRSPLPPRSQTTPQVLPPCG